MNVGFAMCGSFCTYSQVFPVMELLSRDYNLIPIFSEASYSIDSRFGTAKEHIHTAVEICGRGFFYPHHPLCPSGGGHPGVGQARV